MANIKISELPIAAFALGTQEFEVNDSGTSRKVTGTQIATYVRDEVTLGDLGITATATELNYTDGVTSNIQTQLDGKASTATTISAGAGLTGGGSLGADRTIGHADTSSQGSVNNSGLTFIQDITLDTYGHVTGIGSSTVTFPAPDALSTASGSAPSYSARAWVNFNGTGTVAIRASGNVSSITDNGAGDYTVNFTTAMPDANYSAVVTGLGGPSDTRYFNLRDLQSSSVRVGQAGDVSIICVSVFR